MADAKPRSPGRPRLDADGQRASIEERINRWVRKTSSHWMWDGAQYYSTPTTRRYKRQDWPVIATTVRYDGVRRKTIYISAAREMYRMETGHRLDDHVSMVTRCGESMCIRPGNGHCEPMILPAGRAYGLTWEDVFTFVNSKQALVPPPGWVHVVGDPITVGEGDNFYPERVVKEYGYTKLGDVNRYANQQVIDDPRPFAPVVHGPEFDAKLEELGEEEYVKWYQRTFKSRHGEWN